MSAQSLLIDGRVIPTAIVLSHPEQLARLCTAVPEAGGIAVVAGDPRYDRMIASAGLRRRYRHALGVTDDVRLVVVSSTWWSHSLLGSWPSLLRQLMAELPVDRFRVAAILHPHLWFGHGPLQVRLWLADCLRAGLLLVPPEEGWSATLIAADLVVGDHGAVTCDAAALDRPVALATFPHEHVAAGSCVDVLGGLAPVLDPSTSLVDQVVAVTDSYEPGRYAEVRQLVSSVPGEAGVRLRRLCYELLGLDVPDSPVVVPLLAEPKVDLRTGGPPSDAVWASGALSSNGDVSLVRYPADLSRREHPLQNAHLVAHAGHPVPSVRTSADIVFVRPDEFDRDPDGWVRDALTAHSCCLMTAAVLDADRCLVAVRDGPTLRLRRVDDGPDVDPLVAASALYLRSTWDTTSRWTGSGTLRVRLDVGRAVEFDVMIDDRPVRQRRGAERGSPSTS